MSAEWVECFLEKIRQLVFVCLDTNTVHMMPGIGCWYSHIIHWFLQKLKRAEVKDEGSTVRGWGDVV